jgi:chromosome segregation ATPase
VKAREDLDRALLRFTDEHPKVRELRAAIAAIREQITQKTTNGQSDLIVPANSMASTMYLRVVDLQTEKIGLAKQMEEVQLTTGQLEAKLRKFPETQAKYAAANAEYRSLQARRDLLAKYHSDAQFLLESASGWIQVFQGSKKEYIGSFEKFRGAALTALFCGMAAIVLSGMLISVLEVLDGRIRTSGISNARRGSSVLATPWPPR